ncbi:MAG: ABC transporter permease [Mesorhizobium sp.]|uniref:ABC transporter permease n=1 Tax=Mesorhizobium sp. TaxID=1871066 RepID=UPI000FD4E04E|nr:ABC transporter permease [Mesorhizobium sp.]RUY09601.1 ABC transporter permease [Mesorhizobium sp. M2A.F.Ca.ET.040.01.1.1]TIL60570.1 MAG: ABC transporter permease [Mesorhizobium sp.]
MIESRHLALSFVTLLVTSFVLLPIVAIVLFSFNTARFYSLPIEGLTLSWYLDLFADARVKESLLVSIGVALAVTIISTIVGTFFAFFVARAYGRFKNIIAITGFLPLVVPPLVVAAGLQVAFVAFGLSLGYATVISGHVIYTTPFVTLMVLSQLIRYDRRLDAAARDLGAGRLQTLRLVTLPILWPSIRSAAILAFLLSFNEWAIAFFTGRGFNTLPMLVYSMQRNGLPPTVLAYSALSILVVVLMTVLILPVIIRIIRPGASNE